jgi:hypothetical protein
MFRQEADRSGCSSAETDLSHVRIDSRSENDDVKTFFSDTSSLATSPGPSKPAASNPPRLVGSGGGEGRRALGGGRSLGCHTT